MVREASQRARDAGRDGLRVDFVVRGVWEPDRDCLFDIPALYMLAALDVHPNTSLTRMPSIPLPVKKRWGGGTRLLRKSAVLLSAP